MKTNHQPTKPLAKVLNEFEGLKKIEAFEMLSKLELLLFYAPNPIRFEELEGIKLSNFQKNVDIDPFQFIPLHNGNFAQLVGCNHIMYIYKEHKKMMPNWLPIHTYYFKSKYNPLEAIKLTKANILEVFENSHEEKGILAFLTKHSIKKNDENGIPAILKAY